MNVERIVKYENGQLSDEETLLLFSELIKTGMVWQLQGSYGRQAAWFISMGIIDDKGNINQTRMEELRHE